MKGSLSVLMQQRDNTIHFSVSDDGRGINGDTIVARYKQQNPHSSLQINDIEKIHTLLFTPEIFQLGQSHKELQSFDGSISVESHHNRGTTVEFLLPLH